jgi:hypothetical protein
MLFINCTEVTGVVVKALDFYLGDAGFIFRWDYRLHNRIVLAFLSFVCSNLK